jgi:acetyl-CoA C-acetyltransferase
LNEPVYIVDGARTPFLKSRNGPGRSRRPTWPPIAGRALLRASVRAGRARRSHPRLRRAVGRRSQHRPRRALRMGCGQKVPGWTVMRNCASGMQALDSAIANIQRGRSQLVLAGGVDALSRAPLLYSDARW